MHIRVAPVLTLVFVASERLLGLLDGLRPHPAQIYPILRVRRLIMWAEAVLTAFPVSGLKVPSLL